MTKRTRRFPLNSSAAAAAFACAATFALAPAARGADSLARSAEPAAPLPVTVLAEDARGILLQLEIPSPVAVPRAGAGLAVSDEARRFDVSLPGWGRLESPGEPAFPVRAFRIALPSGAIPRLSLVDSTLAPLAVGRPWAFPAVTGPGAVDGEAGGPPRITEIESSEVYGGTAIWPASPVRLGDAGSAGGVPFVDVVVIPVRFEPNGAAGPALVAFRSLTLRVDYGAGVEDPRPGRFESSSRRGAEAPGDRLARTFVNPGLARAVSEESRDSGSAARPANTSAAPPTPDASGNSTSASIRYKLTVNQDGIYRLDHAWISANAPDLIGKPLARYRIMDVGVEIPIVVTDADSDGTFENNGAAADDYVEFAGQKLDWDILDPDLFNSGDWTDDNVYWLDVKTSAALRATTRTGAPTHGYTQPADFPETLHHEVNDMFVQTVPVDGVDHWHQKLGIIAINTPMSQTFAVTVPDPSAATTQASIKVRLMGDALVSYHRSNILVNNVVVDGCGDGAAGCGNPGGGCVDWDGFIEYTHGVTNGAVPFCQSTLTGSTNVKVELPLGRIVSGNPVNADTVYMDWVEISYGRLLKTLNDALVFKYPNANAEFHVTGLPTNKAAVYEISKTLSGQQVWNPVAITGGTITGAGPFTFNFEVPFDATAPATRRYVVAAVTAAGTTGDLLPAAVSAYVPTDILAPVQGTDWLVISDTDIVDPSPLSGLQKLIAFRQNIQAKRVKTVMVGAIYDEFSFGIFDPEAIHDFLAYAWANWPLGPGGARLKDVVLLGDASFDTKNNYGVAGKRTWVPTYVRSAVNNTIVGYYSDDVYFARVNGPDEIPDIHVGRLPVHSLAEANSTAQKILDYEQQAPGAAWQKNVVLAAENTNPDFRRVSENQATNLLAGTPFTINRIYQQDLEPLFPGNVPGLAAEVKDRMQRNINGQVEAPRDIGPGAAVFSFVGHGSWQTWGLNWTTFQTATSGADDLTPLTNFDRLPFLYISNCLSGGFHVAAPATGPSLQYAFAEDFVATASKGAVASLAPAHLAYLQNLDLEMDSVFGEMFGPRKERNIGEVTQALREDFAGVLSTIDLRSYALLGDPATTLVMPAPKAPTNVQVVSIGDKLVSLGWTASPQAAKYAIYRSEFPTSGYVRIANNFVGTAYNDTTVLNCHTYYYQVASLDAAGFEGRRSHFNTDCPGGPDCLKAVPLKPAAPAAPAGLIVVDPESGGRLDVSWTASPASQEATQYTVRWSSTPNNPNPPNQLIEFNTAAILTGLTDGVPYYVTVSATNCSQGEGPRSAEVAGTPNLVLGIKPPRAVSDLKVTRFPDPGDGKDDTRLQWTLPGVDIYGKPTSLASVKIYHATTGAQFALDASHLLVTLAANATIYIHENAFWDATKHYYIVVLTDGTGYASGGGHELPKGIGDLKVSLFGPSQLKLLWSAVTLDITNRLNPAAKYRVYGSPSLFTRAQTNGMTPASTVTATTVNVAKPANPIYYYSVIAEDARGSLSPW